MSGKILASSIRFTRALLHIYTSRLWVRSTKLWDKISRHQWYQGTENKLESKWWEARISSTLLPILNQQRGRLWSLQLMTIPSGSSSLVTLRCCSAVENANSRFSCGVLEATCLMFTKSGLKNGNESLITFNNLSPLMENLLRTYPTPWEHHIFANQQYGNNAPYFHRYFTSGKFGEWLVDTLSLSWSQWVFMWTLVSIIESIVYRRRYYDSGMLRWWYTILPIMTRTDFVLSDIIIDLQPLLCHTATWPNVCHLICTCTSSHGNIHSNG